jgi:hypothetical protein
MRDICRFLRIDIQAPASLPISLIRNTDETITLLARMALLVGRTHGVQQGHGRDRHRYDMIRPRPQTAPHWLHRP